MRPFSWSNGSWVLGNDLWNPGSYVWTAETSEEKQVGKVTQAAGRTKHLVGWLVLVTVALFLDLWQGGKRAELGLLQP